LFIEVGCLLERGVSCIWKALHFFTHFLMHAHMQVSALSWQDLSSLCKQVQQQLMVSM
jgi:hypothetical protein